MPKPHFFEASPGRRMLGFITALLLAGCATAPVPSAGDDSPSHGDGAVDAGAAGAPGASRPRETPSPEVPTVALLQQSERAAEAGDVDEAIGYVERAIRLSPRDPALWLRLAELQLSAGDDARAIQMANKAIALSSSRPDIQRDAWLVVADARERQGDTAEAARIRQRWRTYRG
jgi:tetratricopeptide (TPR) repeat protein